MKSSIRYLKAGSISAPIIALLLASCTNGGINSPIMLSADRAAIDPSSVATLRASKINVLPGSGGGTNSSSTRIQIIFNLSTSTAEPSNVCNTGTTSNPKPCACRFSWEEINTTGGTPISIPRRSDSVLTQVQSGMIECAAPAAFDSEVLGGTVVTAQIVPQGSNPTTFEMKPFRFTRNTSLYTGDFQDYEGRAFQNVHRYACYEQFKRGLEIKNKVASLSNGAQGVLASQFCFSTSKSNQGCATQGYSAQSYYYNLYVRSSERGTTNISNGRYRCPTVSEPIQAGGPNQRYPLDATFALSLNPSASYPVPVDAVTKASDGSARNTSCLGAASGETAPNNSLVKGCLGFAAKPQANGTCAPIKDVSGVEKPAFRLRKYIALYPPQYDTDGRMIEEPQAVDTVYILDRPVAGSGNPLQPFTMRGPKPCPFSYYDHKAVASPASIPNLKRYVATSDSAWDGKNVDGIQFPNRDVEGSSCAAPMPLFNPLTGEWTMRTLASDNPTPAYQSAHIRPVQAWAPHYIEDTSFQACAPRAEPFVDPPLHFAKELRPDGSAYVSWCAMVHPTQNPNILQLDTQLTGNIITYTSPVAKNSVSEDNACVAKVPTNLPSGYPSGGTAHHPASIVVDMEPKHRDANGVIRSPCGTLANPVAGPGCSRLYRANISCDRTASNSGEIWHRFPLAATPDQIEYAITDPLQDGSYHCSMTYDGTTNSRTRAGRTPVSCCGKKSGRSSGYIVDVKSSDTAAPYNAHLEPADACMPSLSESDLPDPGPARLSGAGSM